MKSRNFVNLNVNPCKMCMPMGAVLAFKGIENNMVILHGSQGCSTYIRRHMATHYNEPIDIASSSLTENGTIYGGTNNLKAGLRNMIKLYNPSSIGVITTCLAETIGEDINRIVKEFLEEEKVHEKLKIITVQTQGYGGSHSEGYYRTLRKIVEQVAEKREENNKINIVSANLNPGDVRNIKRILDSFGASYIMLPDVSETLDSPHNNNYKRIPEGGTKIEEIKEMGGAEATIEMGMTIDKSLSPGQYLEDTFGVPLYKAPIPIGLESTDEFIFLISRILGRKIPEDLKTERGRYLDAMIDNHKYTGEARAVIYGEPELVFAEVNLCLENGILPKVVATGAKNEIIKTLLKDKLSNLKEEAIVLDDTDFDTIEYHVKKEKVNIMIGNSDGRRIAGRLGLKILRTGFPVHDMVGAQRKFFTGYNGSAFFIDNVANIILEHAEETFRKDAFNKYYKEENKMNTKEKGNNMEKTFTHPCYNKGAHEFARMHIPVAPKCNISCNYCSRKFDCPNESRPGVTSEVLTPEQALYKFREVKKKIPNLKVLGIAGPGDALANFEETKRSIELIKEEDPDITFCLSTNGLMLPFYANELISLGVSHITVTINAVDKKIGAQIYKEINYLGTKYTGEAAAEILMNNQLTGLRYLTANGVVCKVNTVMIKGVNDKHIVEVIKKVKNFGIYITNIMQLIPVKGSVFEDKPLVSTVELNEMRKECEKYVKQMYHCKQCRADAIGTLSLDRSIDFRNFNGCNGGCGSEKKVIELKENTNNYKFAVATKTGINVDQHFGHAEEFHIYSYSAGNITFLEKRQVDKYCTGIEECDEHEDKIDKIIRIIGDCNAVLAIRAGEQPVKRLEEKGIKFIQIYEGINKGIIKAVKQLLA
ncbi:nitrogenase cofactor biosynthesis protein NifB [Clostridium sp. PL3]|uniref:FeMo cofactor biosynthesis protein NifB n=1 Tax=Clostridium thailandense TaxID=2794346 RepID=A0A949X4C6_9CLOT|nr:nitrogenase cofactor biosynthesis protein NifB [Clostridium thailandense]MBV7273783.1 nitrogenase cofactor biosynthesis protein NifB [Clostridium thailandense]